MRLRTEPLKQADFDVPPAAGGETVIGTGTVFEGTLHGHVDVRICGDVTGEIRCRTIVVDARAAVNASLRAYIVEIAGSVQGRVEAFAVTLEKSAVVEATIVHNRLHIEDGAVVRGLRPWQPEPEMARRCREAAREGR